MVDELDAARLNAQRLEQPSVEVSATMSKARLVGLLVDRKETGAPGEFAGLGDQDSVVARVRAEMGDAAAAALLQALEAEPAELAQASEPTAVERDVVPTHDTDGTRN